MTKVIELRDLQKSFGDHEVLKGINLSVNKGEVVSVIGSSGSGKSTMLRCINLLETPTGGEILFNGDNVQSKEVNIKQYRAKVGMVFQQFNFQNICNFLDKFRISIKIFYFFAVRTFAKIATEIIVIKPNKSANDFLVNY